MQRYKVIITPKQSGDTEREPIERVVREHSRGAAQRWGTNYISKHNLTGATITVEPMGNS